MINDDDEDWDSDQLGALTDLLDTDNCLDPVVCGSCLIPVVEPNRAAMSPQRDISPHDQLTTDPRDNDNCLDTVFCGSCLIPVVEPNRGSNESTARYSTGPIGNGLWRLLGYYVHGFCK